VYFKETFSIDVKTFFKRFLTFFIFNKRWQSSERQADYQEALSK